MVIFFENEHIIIILLLIYIYKLFQSLELWKSSGFRKVNEKLLLTVGLPHQYQSHTPRYRSSLSESQPIQAFPYPLHFYAFYLWFPTSYKTPKIHHNLLWVQHFLLLYT